MNDNIHNFRRSLNPVGMAKSHRVGRMIRKFTDSIGMVYFGSVHQTDDDHRLIRGITASNSHRDRHYSVGTFQGYDVALVLRKDNLRYPDKRVKHHTWLIMTIDLHAEYDIPHVFIAHDKVRELLLAKYSHLTPLVVGIHAPHDPAFTDKYMVMSDISRAVEVEYFITPSVTDSIKTTFGDVAIEVVENTVHLYSTNEYPSRQELEQLLKNGIWLAEKLDDSARRVQNAQSQAYS